MEVAYLMLIVMMEVEMVEMGKQRVFFPFYSVSHVKLANQVKIMYKLKCAIQIYIYLWLFWLSLDNHLDVIT